MDSPADMDTNAIIDRASSQESNVFQYQPGESFVHHMNPITKLTISVSLVIVAFLFPSFHGPFIMTVLVFGIVLASGVVWSVLHIIAIIGTPLAVSLLTIHGLFYPGNETVMYTIGPVPVFGQVHYYTEGFEFALLFIFRILVLMIALLLTIVTTHPKRLTIALMDKGMPSKFAYVFLAALQLIPQLQQRAIEILNAQQARGLDTKANVLQRGKSLFALMIPLLIGSFIATETRALALESRGFTREGTRSYLLEVPDTLLDRGLRYVAVVVVTIVFIWRVAFA